MSEGNQPDTPEQEPDEQGSEAEADQPGRDEHGGHDDAVEKAAAEIEEDPAANPQDPVLREIKGG